MKTKSGFKFTMPYQLRPRSTNVFFKAFNNKVVKCWVKDVEANLLFVGKAKCNTELDTFDEEYGMELALRRALEKRNKFYAKRMQAFLKIHMRNTSDTSVAIINKFQNKTKRGQLSCNKELLIEEGAVNVG